MEVLHQWGAQLGGGLVTAETRAQVRFYLQRLNLDPVYLRVDSSVHLPPTPPSPPGTRESKPE